MKTEMKKPLSWGGGSISFSSESDSPITEEIAMQEQTRLGYMPAGYDFKNFRASESMHPESGNRVYVARWSCDASCGG